ncbi:MAG: hypothetical protein JWN63_614 [Candidatus Acidoferrum typicum]|nr:hypothetical protein [Candidatus Acidoferrum typicum]
MGSSSGAADVEFHLGISPSSKTEIPTDSEDLTYTSSYTDESGNPALRIWKTADGRFLRLAYYDGIQFWLEREGKSLWAVWPAASTLEDTASYLLGPVFGILLRLRGVTCLHASAVSIENRSVVFMGAEGSGKSTTAAAFARQGFGVISDDVAALVESPEGFRVMPAYPHLCLWQDSVEMLYGSSEALPRFSTGWEKRRLALGEQGTRFENRSLPLGAIYLLGDRRPDHAPFLEGVLPKAALLSLVADTFANKILDREMRAREFAVLGRVVTAVPIRRLHPHSDPSRLAELCAAIREDFASLRSPTGARL